MQLDVLAIVGDAVWIFVMATIASATRRAAKVIPADARVPMQWSLRGRTVWRAPRTVAFLLVVGIPLALGLILSAAARAPGPDTGGPLLLFLVRLALAPVMALVHLVWLRRAMRALDSEGVLKP
ncbi:MAG: hypothetical protein JNK30_11515 [Phenylobacterium sp.]|uniref:hypothetical protein n=1 Tax=Phenylobacterium sp. TaxID=1871053 RepID=UPI001A54B754|nr:hypothetical protein [Phenylobacterium sp.]MBL8771999.1 hypothetical protein [Phenylobacterium sp.]